MSDLEHTHRAVPAGRAAYAAWLRLREVQL